MSTLRVNTVTDAAGTGNASPTPIGVGQTYQNVTGSRAFATTYTNSTGQSIFVTVSCSTGGVILVPRVGGVDMAGMPGAVNNNVAPSVYFIVPPGATYSVQTAGNTPTLNQWVELRA